MAGPAFQILDEEFEICDGERTGIWLDGRFHAINKEKKEVLIPFIEATRNLNAILVHENYAEMETITLEKE